MSDSKVSIHLTSHTLTDHNWQLWRREVIMGMRRINAFNIMMGTERRPTPSTTNQATLDPSRLTEARARVADATVALITSQSRLNDSPEDDGLEASFRNAQAEVEEATQAYQALTAEQTAPASTNASTTEDKATQSWDFRHDQAIHVLVMSLSETYQALTINCKSLQSTWQRLETHFESKAAADVIAAEAQLYKLKLNDKDDITEFLNTIRLLRNKLASAGAPISENKLFLTVIEKLPKSMEIIHDTILYGPDDRKTYTALEQTLASYCKNKPKAPVPEQANVATNKDKICKHCKRKGHLKDECRARLHTCKNCGRDGHFEKRCQSKTQDKTSKSSNREKDKDDDQHKGNFAFSIGPKDKRWVVDTGASTSICPDTTPEQKTPGESITMANGVEIPVIGRARAKIGIPITTVLCVPDARRSLLSIGKACEDGDIDSATFDKHECKLYKAGRIIATGSRRNGLYELSSEADKIEVMYASASLEQWHQRLAHSPLTAVKEIVSKQTATGIEITDKTATNQDKCEACEIGKSTRLPFPARDPDHRAREPGRVLHVDLCGPMQTESLQGSRYAMPVIDDYSRFVTTYFMARKSDAAELLLNCIKQNEIHTGNQVKTIQTDNGGEFTSNYLRKSFEEKGIRLQTTIPYTPQQNGTAERMNRTLVDRARTMMASAGLPTRYWQCAMATATHITNRIPSSATNRKSPFELWTRTKPDLQHLRTFGCRAYAHIPDQKRSKFDPKADICTFIGYAMNQKGYLLQRDDDGTIFSSRDVKFNEACFPQRHPSGSCDAHQGKGETQATKSSDEDMPPFTSQPPKIETQNPEEAIMDQQQDDSNTTHKTEDTLPNTQDNECKLEHSQQDEPQSDPESRDQQQLPRPTSKQGQHQRRRSFSDLTKSARLKLRTTTRTRAKPHRLEHEQEDEYGRRLSKSSTKSSINIAFITTEPQTYEQAIQSKQKDQWKEAMNEEYKSLTSKRTWTLSKLPPKRKAIKSKWVYKVKTNSDGTIERYKARLVAQGFSQRHGIDYDDTFSPVATMATIRILISLKANHWHVRQLDVDTAYLNANLDAEIFITQPKGYEIPSSKGEPLVCKLNKAIYATQASRACMVQPPDQASIRHELQEVGFGPVFVYQELK